MNKSSAFVSAIALAAAALTAGHAVAADPATGKTREQVRAELAEAQRTGNFIVDGQTGLLARQMFPGQYPAEQTAQGKTRAQVKQELAEAQRTGNIVVDGETGLLARQMFPGQYPQNAVAQGSERGQEVAGRERTTRSN